MSSLETRTDSPIAQITLNRPEKRNALDDAMRAALADAFAAFDRDDAIRVVVLTGAGTAFCAGVDLSASDSNGNGSPAESQATSRPRLTDPLDKFTKPVIAAINGTAVGGGLELALACDLRIASKTARIGLPEVRVGSLPGSGGTQRLPWAVGPALAAQMLFTGEPISAARALEAGLVSELCEPEELIEFAWKLALSIARNAPLSIVAAKRALRAAIGTHSSAGLDLERSLFNELAFSEDRQEGRLAFRERRPPQFKGK